MWECVQVRECSSVLSIKVFKWECPSESMLRRERVEARACWSEIVFKRESVQERESVEVRKCWSEKLLKWESVQLRECVELRECILLSALEWLKSMGKPLKEWPSGTAFFTLCWNSSFPNGLPVQRSMREFMSIHERVLSINERIMFERVRIMDCRFIKKNLFEWNLPTPVSPKCSIGIVAFPIQFYTLIKQVLPTYESV